MSAQLYINDSPVDMFGNVVIPITMQCTKIAELKITSDYTTQFKIPATAYNRSLFGTSLETVSVERGVYSKIPAKCINGGVEYIGYVIVSSYTGNEIALTFYSGNVNFFAEIEGKKMNDINLTDLTHQFILNHVYQTRLHNWNDGYIYPLINTSATGAGINLVAPIMVFDYLVPMLFVKYLFYKIFNDAGYKIIGNLDDEIFDNLMVDCLTNYADEEYIKCKAVRIANTATLPAATTQRFIPATHDTEISDPSNYIQNQTYGSPYTPFNGLIFKPPSPVNGAKYDFKFHVVPYYDLNGIITWTPANASTFQVGVEDFCFYDGNIYQVIQNPTGALITAPPNDPFVLGAFWKKIALGIIFYSDNQAIGAKFFNDKIEPVEYIAENIPCQSGVWASLLIDSYQTGILGNKIPEFGIGAGTTIECTDAREAAVVDGSYVNMTGQLHDMTQKDFIKEIAQMMGMYFITDATRREVYVHLHKNREKKKVESIDWTQNMVSVDKFQIQYRNQAHGQRNLFKWQDNDDTDAELLDIPNDYCESEFTIDDTVLSKEKTIVESKFSPSSSLQTQWTSNGVRIPIILKYENTINTDPYWRKMNPRILLLIRRTDLFSLEMRRVNLLSTKTYIDNHPLCVFYAPEEPLDITWESLLRENYKWYIKDMQKYIYLYAEMMLNSNDVYQIDFSKPIYLSQFGSYFSLQKISGYVSGKPTKVELLKMN